LGDIYSDIGERVHLFTFCTIGGRCLLTNKQTNVDEDITFLAG